MTLLLPATLPYPDGQWYAEAVMLPHGERLPVIRHRQTWLPAPLALRYVLEMRSRLRPGSLVAEARALSVLYNWAAQQPNVGFLDDWLARGRLPTTGDLKSIDRYLRYATAKDDAPVAGDLAHERGGVGDAPVVDREGEVPATTYHRRLTAVLHFLNWALRWDNSGSPQFIDDDQHIRFVWGTQQLFSSWAAKRPIPESLSPEPLRALDIYFVRRALGADEFGRWRYEVFEPDTRLRNWAMWEVAINYGLRRAELLLMQLGHLPDDQDPLRNIRVPRARQERDDKGLSRKTPRLVTIPVLDPAAYDVVQQYVSLGSAVNRRRGPTDAKARVFLHSPSESERTASRGEQTPSPYEPLSGTRLGQIMKDIGKHALAAVDHELKTGNGVVTLPSGAVKLSDRVLEGLHERLKGMHPHQLRHTWATNLAIGSYDQHGFEGVVRLLRLYGGWASDNMPLHYANSAMEQLGQRSAERRLAALSSSSR